MDVKLPGCFIAAFIVRSRMKLITPSTPVDKSMIVCPLGHVTHVFLACDIAVVCWESQRDDVTSCSAPITPLPPGFTCTNEAQSVPYTLVCDHRPDCVDSSDEDFCVHPPCPEDMLDCGNRQVSSLPPPPSPLPGTFALSPSSTPPQAPPTLLLSFEKWRVYDLK